MKLILSDLDETLLRTDKTISDYTISVLSKCKKNGMLVGFSTSRGKSNITQYVEQIKPDIIICTGGHAFITIINCFILNLLPLKKHKHF